MQDLRTLAQSLRDAGRAMQSPEGGLEGTLEAIARTARDAVPGFDHVGVTVVRGDGTLTTVAATGRFVHEMDTLQYELDQGPCLDALRRDVLVLAEDLPAQEHNWPLYASRASEAGVRAQMGMRLHSHEQTLGGLNFYSTAAEMIHPGAPGRADLFAAHAAIALARARAVDDMNAIADHQVIGQAVGILTEQFNITEDRALYYLVRVSTVAELKLLDVAREVVQQVTGPEG
jgi:GAF domain-containing protein